MSPLKYYDWLMHLLKNSDSAIQRCSFIIPIETMHIGPVREDTEYDMAEVHQTASLAICFPPTNAVTIRKQRSRLSSVNF